MTSPHQRPPIGARGTPSSLLAIRSHAVHRYREQARSDEKQKPVTHVGARLLANHDRTKAQVREHAHCYEAQKLAAPVGASLLAIHNHAKAQVREHARSCEEHNRDPISYRAWRQA